MDTEEKPVECFGYLGGLCVALTDVKVPDECKKCRFRKKERDVTNGIRYPGPIEINGSRSRKRNAEA